MSIYALLAQSLVYPYEGLLDELQAGAAAFPKGPGRDRLAAFLKQVGRLTLAQWEELATRTLDLDPAAAPYVGFQIWGESYQRGAFMAKLARAEAELDIDPAGELPDHLVPVLRYLAAADQPLPELAGHLKTALERSPGGEGAGQPVCTSIRGGAGGRKNVAIITYPLSV